MFNLYLIGKGYVEDFIKIKIIRWRRYHHHTERTVRLLNNERKNKIKCPALSMSI